MASEKVIMYSKGCPQCKALERKFDKLGIEYEIENDTEKMLEAMDRAEKAGIKSFPFIKVNDKYMDYGEAIDWVREVYQNGN